MEKRVLSPFSFRRGGVPTPSPSSSSYTQVSDPNSLSTNGGRGRPPDARKKGKKDASTARGASKICPRKMSQALMWEEHCGLSDTLFPRRIKILSARFLTLSSSPSPSVCAARKRESFWRSMERRSTAGEEKVSLPEVSLLLLNKPRLLLNVNVRYVRLNSATYIYCVTQYCSPPCGRFPGRCRSFFKAFICSSG